jgi:hypothetical protein
LYFLDRPVHCSITKRFIYRNDSYLREEIEKEMVNRDKNGDGDSNRDRQRGKEGGREGDKGEGEGREIPARAKGLLSLIMQHKAVMGVRLMA